MLENGLVFQGCSSYGLMMFWGYDVKHLFTLSRPTKGKDTAVIERHTDFVSRYIIL